MSVNRMSPDAGMDQVYLSAQRRQVAVDAERHWWVSRLQAWADNSEKNAKNGIGDLLWIDLAIALRSLIAERTK